MISELKVRLWRHEAPVHYYPDTKENYKTILFVLTGA